MDDDQIIAQALEFARKNKKLLAKVYLLRIRTALRRENSGGI